MITFPRQIALQSADEQIRQWHAYLTALGYPPALAKACSDPFFYQLKLRTGDVIDFECAEPINSEWVHIDDYHPRGMDVRLADIVYVIDAPDGS